MANRTLVLRCFAERDDDGSWLAICLDLNLYSRGRSAEEVEQRLHQAIGEYVELVRTYPAEDRERLMARPAPWRFRARYAWLLAQASLGAIFHPRPPSDRSDFRKFDDETIAA